nr:hypothetical protein GCM10025732_34380 [Glycomyces mayteni]
MVLVARVGAEPVVGADADPAVGGEAVQERAGLGVLAAHLVVAAVEVDEDGRAGRVRAVPVEVEEVALPAGP